MIFSRDEWPGGHNIAYSPAIWRRILSEWDGVGMNFDPSHLVWQMIDIPRFIAEFGAAHPTWFRRLRAYLVRMARFGGREGARQEAVRAMDVMRKGFRAWLGPTARVGVDRVPAGRGDLLRVPPQATPAELVRPVERLLVVALLDVDSGGHAQARLDHLGIGRAGLPGVNGGQVRPGRADDGQSGCGGMSSREYSTRCSSNDAASNMG